LNETRGREFLKTPKNRFKERTHITSLALQYTVRSQTRTRMDNRVFEFGIKEGRKCKDGWLRWVGLVGGIWYLYNTNS